MLISSSMEAGSGMEHFIEISYLLNKQEKYNNNIIIDFLYFISFISGLIKKLNKGCFTDERKTTGSKRGLVPLLHMIH